jgi:hypothetical protein
MLETLPHVVDGSDGSGPHPCAGSPGSPPSATATGALDDAMRLAGIPWRGNWDPSFRDFFIDRIGPHASAPPDHYWSLTINDRFASGGCLARVNDGDTVHFFFGPLFGPEPPAAAGEPDGNIGAAPKGPSTTPGPTAVTKKVRGLAARAAIFLRHRRGEVGADWGRLALALRSGRGGIPAARALLDGRLGRLRNGSIDEDANATALAVLALRLRRPAAAEAAAKWLESVQGPGGGFGFRPGVSADVDSTGLCTWALALTGHTAAARRGAGFVRAAEAADGGFPSLPGGASNAQSTGLALVALRVAGDGPRVRSSAGLTPLDFIAALARSNGSISYVQGDSPTPVWTTAQALLGLTSAARLLGTGAKR